MATRSRLPATTNAGMVEHGGVTSGGKGSLGTNRLVITADAAQAAASAALAAASQAAAAASAAAGAASAAAALVSANNADTSEAAALASQNASAASAAAAAASEAATASAVAAAVAAEATLRTNADALLLPKAGHTYTGAGVLPVYGTTSMELRLGDTGGSAGSRYHALFANGGTLSIINLNDNFTVKNYPLQFNADATAWFANDITLSKTTGAAQFSMHGTTSATILLGESSAGTNLKYSHIVMDDGALSFKLINDAFTTKSTPLTINADGTSTFTNNVGITSASANALFHSFGTGAGFLRLGATGSGSNLKYGDVVFSAGLMEFRLLNDNLTVKHTPLYFNAVGSAVFGSHVLIPGVLTTNGEISIEKASALIRFKDTSGTANTRQFSAYSEANVFGVAAYNDAGTWQRTLLTIPHGGGVVPTSWATAARPASPINGLIGYNTDTNQLELYRNTAWHTIDTNIGTELKYNEAVNVGAVDFIFPANARGCRIHGFWNPTVNADNLVLRTDSNGGASFDTGAADYKYGYTIRQGAARTEQVDVTGTYILATSVPGGDDLFPFEIMVSTVSGAFAVVTCKSVGFNGSNTTELQVVGFRQSTTAIDAVRLLATTGNIATMRYRVEWL